MAIVKENPPSRSSIHDYAARFVKRLSWGSIFAATFIVLAVQVTLVLLGMAIGLSTINPATEAQPFAGVTTGAAIWWFVSAIISLFIGGWFAARFSGIPSRFSGAMHGLVSWGFASAITMYMLTTTIGSLVGGTLGVVGSVLSGSGQIIASIAPAAVGAATGTVSESTWDRLRADARNIVSNRLRPGTQNNEAANNEIVAALDRVIKNPSGRVSTADRNTLVNALMARTDMSRGEAEATVNQWVQNYQSSVAQARGTTTEAVQRAQQYAEQAADTLAKAALWAFLTMLFGAAAALAGGALGAPFDEGTRMYTEQPAGRMMVEEEVPVR